jgi:hypothetical protein
MAEGKVEALNIEIMGKLDPSLMATINTVKAKLKELGADARTSNEVLKRTYSQMFDGMGRGAKQAEHNVKGVFHRLQEAGAKAAEHISHSFKHAFHEIGTEVMKGIGFGAGFSIVGNISQGIGSIMEGAKEFAHGAVEVHAEREALQSTIHSILSSQGRGGQAAEMDMMFRQFEGQKGPETYQQLSMATTQLLGAAPERFKTVGSVETQLQHLADVSRDATAFSGVTQAYTRILAEGKVDAGHLREMSVDTGFNFKKAMADALKVTPEQLSEMIAKHKLSGEKSIEALMKGMELITGPGGAAYQHAEAQLQGLNGIFKRFEGHFQDFQDSFGMQMENFLRPIANTVLSYLTPSVLTHAFDQFEGLAKGFGQSIAYLVDVFGKDIGKEGNVAKFIKLGDAIKGFFATVFNLGKEPMTITSHISPNETGEILNPRWQAKLDELSKTVSEAAEKLAGMINAITANWQTIKDGMLVVATAWAGKKVYDIAKGIRDFLGEIGVMEVRAQVVNIQGGIPGKSEAGEVAKDVAIGTGARAIAAEVASFGLFSLAGAGAGFGGMALGGWAGSQIADRYHIVPYDPERDRWSKIWQDQKEMDQMRASGLGTQGGGPSIEQQRSYDELKLQLGGGQPQASTDNIKSSFDGAVTNLAPLPDKASEISGHLDSVASTFSGLPGKASEASSAMDSFVAAINAAVAKANASIASMASVHASAMLV